jgi:hypothetical protein
MAALDPAIDKTLPMQGYSPDGRLTGGENYRSIQYRWALV